MKITKRQLRRIIRESIKESFGGIMGHVHGDPSKPKFEDLAFDAVKRRDFEGAANSIMDSFMMDDPDPEDVNNLMGMLAGLPAGAQLDDLRRVVNRWRKSPPQGTRR